MSDTLLDAAITLDLAQLQNAASSAPTSQLLERHAGGITVVHGLLGGFHFFKAGELSGLVPWPVPSRTVYAQDVRGVLGRASSVRARRYFFFAL